jgi:nitric oxide reductase subunit B
MGTTTKRGFLLAKGWIQAVLLVTLFGFFVLGFLAYKTYTGEPPIPGKVVNPDGQVLFTRADIMAGQGTFLQNGLMEYGSIFGHGAYLGPDFTADYLHRAALMSVDFYNGLGSDQARAVTIADFKTNRYDSASDTLTFTAAQVNAFNGLQSYYYTFFAEPTTKYGLRPNAITNVADSRNLTAFFAWSAWCIHVATRAPVLVHEQLASGTPGGQSCNSRHGRLERPFIDCLTWRYWPAACGIRALESSWLAWT